jgi:hypothetical protein
LLIDIALRFVKAHLVSLHDETICCNDR